MAINATINFNESQLRRLEAATGGGGGSGVGAAASALGGGGGVEAIAGVVGVMSAVAIGIGAVVSILMDGFGGTIKLLGKLMKILSLILKPIDMLVMSLIQPLFWVLMPFIKSLNLLLLPYIKGMRAQIRESKTQIQEGGFPAYMVAIQTSLISGVVALLDPLYEIFVDLATMIMGLVLPVLNQVLSVFFAIAGAVANFLGLTDLAKTLGEIGGNVTGFLTTVTDNLDTIGDNMKNVFDIIGHLDRPLEEGVNAAIENLKQGDKFENLLGTMLDGITGAALAIFGDEEERKKFTEPFNIAAEAIQKDLLAFFGEMQANIGSTLTSMMTELDRLYGMLNDFITPALEDLNGALEDLENFIKSVQIALGGDSDDSNMSDQAKLRTGNYEWQDGKLVKVRDFVVTPGGQVLQTDPADYILGTRNPGSLGGGGGNTININIEASIASDYDVDRLSQQLAENMDRQLAGVMKRGF